MAEVINTKVFDVEKKFVDFAGLDYFWEKAKAYVDGADATLAARAKTLEDTVNGYTPENGEKVDGLVQKVAALRTEVDALGGVDGGIKGMIDASIAALDLPNTYEAKGEAAKAEAAAKAYADGLASNYDAVGAAAQALTDAKAYVDGIVGDVTGEDGVVTKGLNSRIADLEAIDHEKLASDASAAAVATILDNAPASFDTLKEVADWIANNDHADDVAGLMTDVANLKKIDHDAYKAADTALETSLKGYVDGKDTAMDTRVKVLEGRDVYVKDTVDAAIADAKKAGTDAAAALDAYKPVIEKSVEDAQAAAIAKAAEDAAKMLESYYTKTEVDGLVAGAKTYADGLKTEIEGVIAENERVTSEALTDLDDRVKVIEAQDVYVKDTVDAAIADAKKAGTDAAAALDTYKGVVTEALADNSAADQAYAKQYTDELFASFKFATNSDIDALFAAKAE